MKQAWRIREIKSETLIEPDTLSSTFKTMGFSRSDARGAIPTSIFAYLFLPFAHANYIGNCWFNSFSTADKQDVPYGLRRHIYIYIMTIVLQNADLLYIKYESQESIEINVHF